jgi:hypothetical protein
MKKRIVIEVEIPPGPKSEETLTKIFNAIVTGLGLVKKLGVNFEITHQHTEDVVP